MTTAPTRRIAAGPKGQVVSLVLPTSVSPADDFLRGLDERAQTAFKARCERLTQIGFLRSPEAWRRLDVAGSPVVCEIKVDKGPGYRLYVIQRDATLWVATHGCKKPKDKAVPGEVSKARSFYERWREWL
jgi:putative component of toxin-antitoxin plasmid stabilization module